MKKIAVFGSAFNPPSLGHKSVIDSLTHFDCTLLVPSIAHAWGKTMLDYDIRCELLDDFISDLALPNVLRSTVEQELYLPGESVTTFAVLNRIQELYPHADITFVIGPDNFFKFSKFYKAEQIMQRWCVMACPETVNVRSTDIRNRLMAGEAIDDLTTVSVSKKLQHSNLY